MSKLNIFNLEEGSAEQAPQDQEIIFGTPYKLPVLDKTAEKAASILWKAASKYKLTNKPLDIILEPYSPVAMSALPKTVLRPVLAVQKKESEKTDWVIDFTDKSDALTYCFKPLLMAQSGVSEYWVINAQTKSILIYDFNRHGFIPTIVDSPRRIKVGIYDSFYIGYSDIFKP